MSEMKRKYTMLYDGDCKFCIRWIRRWEKMTGGYVKYIAYQERGEEFRHISDEECETAVQLVDDRGEVYSAARAVLRSLDQVAGMDWMINFYEKNPKFAQLTEGIYRWVVRNRGWL